MKAYKNTEVKIIRFACDDVMTGSGIAEIPTSIVIGGEEKKADNYGAIDFSFFNNQN